MTENVFPALLSRSTSPRWASVLREHAIVLSLALVAVFALLDHATGVEATFVELTYLVPIAIMAWFRSRAAALAVAALATAASTWIFVANEAPPHLHDVLLNALASYGMFVAFIAILHALRQHVERERAQRRAAVEQLRHAERLHVIGTLAAGVAHELGTPLNVITGAAEMIGDRDVPRTRVTELTALILRQTEQITSIIRHLLEFGRRGGTATTDVDADRAVAATAELLATTARKHHVELVVSLGLGADHPARASAREIEQVVSNLLLNGIQAMARGGTLRVATRLEQRPEGSWAAIAVEDEGDGIRPEHLPYIFDPFFTTKGIGEGTGLGLSVSYGIVSDWGGRIEVDSQPGHGARFVVLVPLA
ncbi:MAG: sensor histidine kinase [Acidobacteriota bacterium]